LRRGWLLSKRVDSVSCIRLGSDRDLSGEQLPALIRGRGPSPELRGARRAPDTASTSYRCIDGGVAL
jgi:hypothetical protein